MSSPAAEVDTPPQIRLRRRIMDSEGAESVPLSPLQNGKLILEPPQTSLEPSLLTHKGSQDVEYLPPTIMEEREGDKEPLLADADDELSLSSDSEQDGVSSETRTLTSEVREMPEYEESAWSIFLQVRR